MNNLHLLLKGCVDWLYVLENQQITVYCNPGDQFGGSVIRWVICYFMIVCIFTISIYIFLGLYIKLSRLEDSQMALNRRIYKSLAIVMSVIFFLYFMGAFGTLFIPMLTNDPQISFVYFHLCVQFIALAGAINAPVLYFCSSEYRKAMNQQWPFILTVLKVCRIMSMNNNNNTQIIVLSSAITIQPANKAAGQIYPIAIQKPAV